MIWELGKGRAACAKTYGPILTSYDVFFGPDCKPEGSLGLLSAEFVCVSLTGTSTLQC